MLGAGFYAVNGNTQANQVIFTDVFYGFLQRAFYFGPLHEVVGGVFDVVEDIARANFQRL